MLEVERAYGELRYVHSYDGFLPTSTFVLLGETLPDSNKKGIYVSLEYRSYVRALTLYILHIGLLDIHI